MYQAHIRYKLTRFHVPITFTCTIDIEATDIGMAAELAEMTFCLNNPNTRIETITTHQIH